MNCNSKVFVIFLTGVKCDIVSQTSNIHVVTFKKEIIQVNLEQKNAMRCNNRDNLLQLSFSLKISIFSEAYI